MQISKVESLFIILASSMLLFMLIAIPIDIINFLDHKDEYADVYSVDDENWEWNYLKSWFYLGLLILSGLAIISLRIFKRDNNLIKKVNWIFLVLFFTSIIVGYYKWMITGFDH